MPTGIDIFPTCLFLFPIPDYEESWVPGCCFGVTENHCHCFFRQLATSNLNFAPLLATGKLGHREADLSQASSQGIYPVRILPPYGKVWLPSH